jgi:DNA repair exonuclease SbcCD ATPase subunit
MSQSARVSSIEAVKAFREALCTFSEDAQRALCAADQEIRRTLDGLQARLQYWQRMVRECQEEVTRAKTALIQRRWGHHEGRGPGTTEQEIALRKAQARLKEAEAKVETVRRWQLQLPQAIHEYEGPARQLAGWLDADLRHVVAILDQRLAALEAYVALTPSSPADPAAAETESGDGAPAAGAPGPSTEGGKP